MFIQLIRHYFSEKYVIGKLYIADVYVCDTLEPSLTAPHPAIPCGSYPVRFVMSPKFERLMPRLIYVPNRSGILIHSGNTYRDTQGCILVGYNDVTGSLLNSRRCFVWLYAVLLSSYKNDDSIVFQIKNKCL